MLAMHFRFHVLALFKKSLWRGFDKKWVSTFLSAVRNSLLVFGGSATSETSELQPKTSQYARFWAQNARKIIARYVPESVANLFLRKISRLSHRLLLVHVDIFQKRRDDNKKIRVAGLQNEVGTKYFFRGTNFLMKNAPIFPQYFEPLFWVRKNPARCSAKNRIPPNKKQIADELLQERREKK